MMEGWLLVFVAGSAVWVVDMAAVLVEGLAGGLLASVLAGLLAGLTACLLAGLLAGLPASLLADFLTAGILALG
jgi:hypothetical protein